MSQNMKRANSNISEDSLEAKPQHQEHIGAENYEKYPSHIHVPFHRRASTPTKQSYLKLSNEKLNIHPKLSKTNEYKNYLTLNKRPRKQKTYLQRFREKFSKVVTLTEEEKLERVSVEGEYGDSARRDAEVDSIRSVGGDSNIQDFFNTECYNEMCYQSLINGNRCFDNIHSVCREELKMDLASIEPSSTSGVTTTKSGLPTSLVLTSGTRRPSQVLRGSTEPPSGVTRLKSSCSGSAGGARGSLPGAGGRGGARAPEHAPPVCQLGSLGPDVESLRPRLERARSVQRYSERVRIDNKMKIFRHRSLQTDAPNKKPQVKPSNRIEDKTNKNNKDTKNNANCKVVKHSKSDQSALKERDRAVLNKNKIKLNVKKQAEEDFSKGDSKGRLSSETTAPQNSPKLDSLDFDRRRFSCGERLRQLEERHSALQAAVRGDYAQHSAPPAAPPAAPAARAHRQRARPPLREKPHLETSK